VLLARAIGTVLEQTISDFEVIVVIDDEWLPTKLERQLALPPHGRAVLSCQSAAVVTAPESLVRHYAEEDRMSKKMRGLQAERAFSGFWLAIGAHQAVRLEAAVPGQFLS
jgi:hypothetical protein